MDSLKDFCEINCLFEMIVVMTEILCSVCFCDSSGDERDEKERKEKPPVEVQPMEQEVTTFVSSDFPRVWCARLDFFIFRKQVLKRSWKSKSHAGVGHLRSGRTPKRTSLKHLKNLRRWSRLRALEENVQDPHPVKAPLVRLPAKISQRRRW